MSALLFGGRVLPCTDPCAICRIVIDDETWYSVEHYYQANKFLDAVHRNDIKAQRPQRIGPKLAAAQHGALVRGMGASESYERDPNFRPLEALYVATRVKFEQNMNLRQLLVEAGGAITVPEGEASEDELSKWHPRVIARLREELRPEQERDVYWLNDLRSLFQEQKDFDEAKAMERVAEARTSFGAHLRTIVARKLDGSTHEVVLHPNDKIEEAREQLGFQLGFRPTRLILLKDCDELEDGQTVNDLSLEDRDEISLIVRSPIPHGHTHFSAELQASIRDCSATLRTVDSPMKTA